MWASSDQFTNGSSTNPNNDSKTNGLEYLRKYIGNILAKTRTLQAKWTVETQEDLFQTYEINAPKEPEPKWCNSIFESIFRELYQRYKNWRNPPFDIEKELTEALSQEIVKEIDDQILKDLIAATKIPKDQL